MLVWLETRKSLSPLHVFCTILHHCIRLVWNFDRALAPPVLQLTKLGWRLYCLPKEHWRVGGYEDVAGQA